MVITLRNCSSECHVAVSKITEIIVLSDVHPKVSEYTPMQWANLQIRVVIVIFPGGLF